MAVFDIGQKFYSLADLESARATYERENYVNLVVRDAKTLEAMRSCAPKRVKRANFDLRYYAVRLCCSFGGKKFKKQGTLRRKTETRKVDCGMQIRLLLSDDGLSLDVVKIRSEHTNHMISQDVYLHLPQQRRLNTNELRQAQSLLSLQANKKFVQQHIQNVTGKVVLLKDIANYKYRLKKEGLKTPTAPNSLQQVLQQLQEIGDSTVEVLVTEDNVFQGLFYQDWYMHSVFDTYPDIILFNATNKLLDLGLAVLVMLAVDGNGQSEIVGLILLADESRLTVMAAIQSFQNHNPSWINTVSVTTDRDFAHRQVLNSLFPDASLKLSLFQTLRTFRRDVTPEKMSITAAQRDDCLAIIQDMANAADEDEYLSHFNRLRLLPNCSKVVKYVESSWHALRAEWVAGLESQPVTFTESTKNSHLDKINSKLKSVCNEHVCLQRFFEDFNSFLASMRLERQHRALMMFTKRPTNSVVAEMAPYVDYLTPYAFRLVAAQYEKSLKLECSFQSGDTFEFDERKSKVVATLDQCTCRAYTSKRLPCRHLLYARRCVCLPFDASIMDGRWNRSNYVQHCTLRQSDISNCVGDSAADDETISVTQINEPASATDVNEPSSATPSFVTLVSEPSAVIAADDEPSVPSAIPADEPSKSTTTRRFKEPSRRPTATDNPKTSYLSQAAKYRKARHLTDGIASLCSEHGTDVFASRLELLQLLYDTWSRGDEMMILSETGVSNVATINAEEFDDVAAVLEYESGEALASAAGELVLVEPDTVIEVYDSQVDPDVPCEAAPAMPGDQTVVLPSSAKRKAVAVNDLPSKRRKKTPARWSSYVQLY